MTRLLEEAIEAGRSLPDEQQDALGMLLLNFANAARPRCQMTPEQIDDVKQGVAEAERGEFVSEEEMAAFWRKFGR